MGFRKRTGPQLDTMCTMSNARPNKGKHLYGWKMKQILEFERQNNF